MRSIKFIILFGGMLLTLESCFVSGNICTHCTEKKSGDTSNICDSERVVRKFEKKIVEEGKQKGEDWNCVRQN